MTRNHSHFALRASLFVLLVYEAHAAPGDLLWTFNNPMPASGDVFGYSVATVGNNIVVGARWDDPGGVTDAGTAYVFNATTGTLLLTINNPTPASGDQLGYSVAAAGNTILVGAPYDNTGATDAGSVYLFDGATGALLRTINNPTPAFLDQFGHSVAALGSNILVGAHFDDTGGINPGSVYLFNGATGALLLTINNPTPVTNGQFGRSVAAVGSNILVGAYSNGSINAGSAYLFNGATGALLRTINNPTPESGDSFGWSVAGVGNNVLVGAPLDNTGAISAGSAYLFNGATGTLLRTFNNPTPADDDNFGISVASVGNNILVGSPDNGFFSSDPGSAYLFNGSSGALVLTFNNPTPAVGDAFGYSVAAAGNNILVGTPYDNTGANGAGSAYLFEGWIPPNAARDWTAYE